MIRHAKTLLIVICCLSKRNLQTDELVDIRTSSWYIGSMLTKKGPIKLTTSDLTRRYNVTREAVYKWIKKGLIPADMIEEKFHGTVKRFYFQPRVKDFLDSIIREKRLRHSRST